MATRHETADPLNPDDEISGQRKMCIHDSYRRVYGTTPWHVAIIKAEYRQCDSDNPDPLGNYGEGFVEIHGFF